MTIGTASDVEFYIDRRALAFQLGGFAFTVTSSASAKHLVSCSVSCEFVDRALSAEQKRGALTASEVNYDIRFPRHHYYCQPRSVRSA
jgi:hypothetical protein